MTIQYQIPLPSTNPRKAVKQAARRIVCRRCGTICNENKGLGR